MLTDQCGTKLWVCFLSVSNQISGFNLPWSWEAWRSNATISASSESFFGSAIMKMCKHMKTYIYSFYSSALGLDLAFGSQSIQHPCHLLYFTLISCWACTPTFTMETSCHKKSQYYRVICSMYLILWFSYNGNFLTFISSLGWFCLLMLLLP